jgi:DNA-binding GntR family transcriptional regulator
MKNNGHPEPEAGSTAGEFRSRTSEAYERIREDVISGKLAPGCKLKIDQLREEYEVGGTPVREALSYLAADGLVVREEQRGFRVAEVSAEEFEELLHIRCSVEERALRLAIKKGGKAWEEGIVVARYRLFSREHQLGMDTEWERHHKNFHMSLIAGCGSNILMRLCKQLYDENNRYRYFARLHSFNRRHVKAEHEAIAAATLARESDRAVDLLVSHYIETGNLLRVAIRELTASPST